jgi:mono/diheme cytochrome c family protein
MSTNISAVKIIGVLCFELSLLFITSCEKNETPITSGDPVEGAPSVINLEQGWTADIQNRAWYASFGSRIIPYDWFLVLEHSDNRKMFRAGAFMEELGFLVAAPTANNKDGLPVGFSRDTDDKGVEWVGLTCAACHTGEVHYQGTRIRIDGGAGLIDYSGFEQSLIKALTATVADGAKFDRFAQAVEEAGSRGDALKTDLIERIQYLEQRQRLNRVDVAYGHGRLDAFGQIFNAVAVEFLQQPGNRRAPDAPVSYPVLWSAPHLDLVQWNGSAPNAGPGPLLQNVTTALAVYGTLDMNGHSGKTGYPSSVNFNNLGHIQEWVYLLTAPQWPEKILGALDQEKVKRGSAIYQDNCESCHHLSGREPGRKLKAELTRLDEIGTDPKMVENFLNATAETGILEGRKVAFVAGDTMGKHTGTVNLVVHAAIGATLKHPLKAVHDTLESYHSVYSANVNQHPNYYKARPLDGIWSSAPYLHNGSVSNLYELLLPAEQRSREFYVGGRELDVKKVGLLSDPQRGSLFDTTRPGNANSGHEYGSELSEAQRWDLIEYLKSL